MTKGHRLGVPRQVHRCLAGRVGASDDVDVLAVALGRDGHRRPVVDTRAGQSLAAVGWQLPVRHAGRQDDRARTDLSAVGELHRAAGASDLQRGGFLGGDELGVELDRLPSCSVGELCARKAIGEAEVVLDSRTLAGLAAGGGALDENGLESLGRAVHRGRQARRAAADHDEVVEILGRRRRQAQRGRQLGVGGIDERRALLGDDHRQRQAVLACRLQQSLTVGLVSAKPRVVQLISREKFPHLRRPGVPRMADDLGVGDDPVAGGLPGVEQRVDHRVQLLLGWVPRLEEIVIEVDDVDGLDRGVSVGVCGQQYPAGERVDVHRLFEELDAAHLGHPVVGDVHRHGVAAELQFVQRFQSVRPGFGADDAVVLAVVAAQVAGHCAGDGRVVVDGENHRAAALGGRSSHRCQVCARAALGTTGGARCQVVSPDWSESVDGFVVVDNWA